MQQALMMKLRNMGVSTCLNNTLHNPRVVLRAVLRVVLRVVLRMVLLLSRQGMPV